jgi:hypothetical protein
VKTIQFDADRSLGKVDACLFGEIGNSLHDDIVARLFNTIRHDRTGKGLGDFTFDTQSVGRPQTEESVTPTPNTKRELRVEGLPSDVQRGAFLQV